MNAQARRRPFQRRLLLKGWLCITPGLRVVPTVVGATLFALGPVSAAQAQAGVTAFEMRLPVALLPQLRRDPAYPGLKVVGDADTIDPTKGLPLIYIAVGALMLPDLARTLLALYRDYKYGGTVIEVKQGQLQISQSEKLDADTIVVKDATGKVSIHRNRSAASLEKWTELLLAAAAKP